MQKLQGVSVLKQYIRGEISYETYQQKLKMQNHHVKEEEIKNQDNNAPNKIMYNMDLDNGEINQNIMSKNVNSPDTKNNNKKIKLKK